MTNLAVFSFNDQEVRFIEGKPVANDVAKILDYKYSEGKNLDCYHAHDILAIAVEFLSNGEDDKAEKAFQFIKKFGMVDNATTERLYHACRIYQAWATTSLDKKDKQSGYIYLIGCVKNRTLKIGFSSTPEKRLQQLQVSSPHKLSILAKIEGSKSLESQLHKEFAHIKLNGEWFKWDETVIQRFVLLNN